MDDSLTSPKNSLRVFRIKKTSSDSQSNSSNPPRRRIIQLPSDSDSDTSPHKNVVIENESSNGFSRTDDSITEKEFQLKYLLATFPNADAMELHDILSRFEFNGDLAALEMSKLHLVELPEGGFETWKENFLKKLPQFSQNKNAGIKRQFDFGNSNLEKKTKKLKRSNNRDSEDDDDDDDEDVTESNFYKKAAPVYDSDDSSDYDDFNDTHLSSDKKQVLEFFQTATLSELQLMSHCSKKKAELLKSQRPFSNWTDLVAKLESNKNLSTDFLNSAQHVLSTRNNIRNLMKKCTNLAQQLERAVSTSSSGGLKYQPKILSPKFRLTNYQLIGLNWLVVLHTQQVNGILADEMGLGKTVQVIAFLSYLKERKLAKNVHLVVVPASTLNNWMSEFNRWCPELRIFMYYGSTEERRQFRVDFSKGILSDFDVILTTYTLAGNTPEERKMFRVTPLHYVIFDEAHMLKNMNTQRYDNLARINARHRILLTGTPLQNNLLELMSLLIFVMPQMFAEKTCALKNLFQKNSKTKDGGSDDDSGSLPLFEREQIEQAKRIMKPFVLRRLKSDVLQDLPKKIDHVISVPMAPVQKDHYEELVESYKRRSRDDGAIYNGVSLMTDLRKLSNHPLLLRYHYDDEQCREMATLLAKDPTYKDTVVDYIVQDLQCMSDFEINTLSKLHRCLGNYMLPNNLICTSGKFLHLDRLLPELQRGGHRVLIFSQYVILLNVLEQYVRLRKYRYLRLDGNTPVSERQELINKYNDDGDIFLFLLSTKAGGLGINLTAADTVIIHDIDFNPYNDKQAEDRCHRMGQTKTVTVYRLISQGTIEEGMLQLTKEKLKLEKQITTDENDNPDLKSVVKLLSTALGVDYSPQKKL